VKIVIKAKEFHEQHFTDVCNVMHSCGLGFDNHIFHRHFLQNPIANRTNISSCIQGVVLTDGDRVVGFQGAVLRELFFKKNPVLAYEMGVLGIEKDYRLYAPMLTNILFNQKQVIAFLGNTFSLAASRMYKMARFKNGPDSCTQIRFGIILWRMFLPSVISRTRFRKYAKSLLVRSLGLVIDVVCSLFIRLPYVQSMTDSKVLRSIDQNTFCDFWDDYLENNEGLVMSRTPDVLEWLFGEEIALGRNTLIGRFDKEKLVGYIVLRQKKLPNSDSERFVVIDWIAINNDKRVLSDLLRDGREYTLSQGAAVLEILGYPESCQEVISQYFPFKRKIIANSFMYKTVDSSQSEAFREQADKGWFWGAMDADRCVML